MSVYKTVLQFIKKHKLIGYDDHILLSLSAGKDSMAMFYILNELKNEIPFNISIFHLNHKIRGEESDNDENFVKELADSFKLRCYCRSFDFLKNAGRRSSFEESAREVRYSMLKEITLRNSINKIATAHNFDDNIETVVMRIFTGTGINGLAGIKALRENIIRPLLCLTSSEIYKFLIDNNIKWREDPTNRDDKYLRNYVRNIMLPHIKKRFPQAVRSVEKLSRNASEAAELIESLAGDKLKNLIAVKNDHVLIDLASVCNNIPLMKYIISEVMGKFFKKFVSASLLNEVIKNLNTDRSNLFLYSSSDIHIEKIYLNRRSYIKICRNHFNYTDLKSKTEWEYPVKIDKEKNIELSVKEAGISISIRSVDFQYFKDNFSRDKIFVSIPEHTDTIIVRNRRRGDKIRLERGLKKIKDLLIEKKLDISRKNLVPLLIIDSNIAAFMPGLLFDCSNRVSLFHLVNSKSKKILVINSVEK